MQIKPGNAGNYDLVSDLRKLIDDYDLQPYSNFYGAGRASLNRETEKGKSRRSLSNPASMKVERTKIMEEDEDSPDQYSQQQHGLAIDDFPSYTGSYFPETHEFRHDLHNEKEAGLMHVSLIKRLLVYSTRVCAA